MLLKAKGWDHDEGDADALMPCMQVLVGVRTA
jgi:hypothetical protein